MTKDKPISIFTKQAVEEDGSGLYDSYQSLQLDEFNKVIVDENGKSIPPEGFGHELTETDLDDLEQIMNEQNTPG